MFKVTEKHTVYLYPGITDFRLGIYGLRKLIKNELTPGSIYIFANKTLNSIKVIEIEANAVWLYQKKLHRGKFGYPRSGDVFTLSQDEVNFIIEGVSLINKIETNGKIINRKFY
ncbi:MAG TPA: IS66 family insertion sequence element accessory protein TnpB [Bacilli bacterium]|nr:IS66 family insertion sequence element accessory protein TnpB [Bacilli bacterium]